MRVLVISPEAGRWPFSGSLADSVNELACAYMGLHAEVRVYSPCYQCGAEPVPGNPVEIYQGVERIRGEAFSIGHIEDSPYYFVHHPGYFQRTATYNDPDNIPFWDNHYRFSMLAAGALQHAMDSGYIPDMIHCHEWGGSLVGAYARRAYADVFGAIPVLLSIHNLEYDFHFLEHDIERIGLDRADFHIDGYEFWGKVSMLKAGILYADKIIFASEGYRREVLERDLAGGIRGFLEVNQSKIVDVQHGIDYASWASLQGRNLVLQKQLEKERLQKEIGLNLDRSFLVYCHLDRETMRTAETLFTILSDLLHLPIQLVVGLPLGHGEQDYFHALAAQHPGRFALLPLVPGQVSYRHALAGADLLFLSNTAEPSASLILKSLANGTLPLTGANAGCASLLSPFEGDNLEEANAFIVEDPWPDQMLRSLRFGLDLYSNERKSWDKLVENALAFHFSWEQSAAAYLQLIN